MNAWIGPMLQALAIAAIAGALMIGILYVAGG